MSLQKNLKELGLNDKEITIYTSLLRHGRRTPASLSVMTKVNRATVYSVAKSLQSKNLIAEDLSGKTLYLVPLPAENLNNILEQSKRELQEKEKIIEEAVSELKNITAEKEYPVPKIRFIQEENLEKFLYDNTIKWQQSALDDDGIWWGFQDSSFAEQYEKWIDWTLTTKQSKDLRYGGRVISNISLTEKKLGSKYLFKKRGVRTLLGTNLTSSIWVGGEYIVMVMTKHHPFYIIEIHDKFLAHNMKEMIKKIWGMSIASD